MVIESMLEEKLSYRETARRFEINCDKRIKDWERISLTEGPAGFMLERRDRGPAEEISQGSGRGFAYRSSAAADGE